MYDVDGNGWIDLGEMTKIVKSIYKMMGPNQALMDQFESPEKRAQDIFQKMDVDSDGRVTRQEFVRCDAANHQNYFQIRYQVLVCLRYGYCN